MVLTMLYMCICVCGVLIKIDALPDRAGDPWHPPPPPFTTHAPTYSYAPTTKNTPQRGRRGPQAGKAGGGRHVRGGVRHHRALLHGHVQGTCLLHVCGLIWFCVCVCVYVYVCVDGCSMSGLRDPTRTQIYAHRHTHIYISILKPKRRRA